LPAAILPLPELPELELLEEDELLELDEVLLEELLELEDELLELGSPELEPLPPQANNVADNSSGTPQRPRPVGFLRMRMCVTRCHYGMSFFLGSSHRLTSICFSPSSSS
jgi:hypothetical protein